MLKGGYGYMDIAISRMIAIPDGLEFCFPSAEC